MQRRYILLIFVWMLFSGNMIAQNSDSDALDFPPPDDPPEIFVSRASGSIRIDGRLDEADWGNASITSDFFRIEPRQGGDIKYATEVKFLYDDKYLYIAAFCRDSAGIGGIRVQDLRRDFIWGENDIFGVALDPQNLKQYAQAFQTTPYGNQRDFQNFNGNNYDIGWNTLWSVRTRRTADGYTAEFAIPFHTLRYDYPEDGCPVEWGVAMVRYARRDVEVSTFPAIPQSLTPYRMTYAARLKGIKVPPPSANVRIEPYSLFQYDNADDPTQEGNGSLKVGGDIKWASSPRSVLDFTVNTDFAQAEVDRAINNFERFNIFFPERRQFFLENSGIWAGGVQQAIRPFFSRKIGLQGSFNAKPAPIHVGLRYTQRTEKQALAGMVVRQGATEQSPISNFGVARYLRNYGRENNIGIMATYRLDESSHELGLSENNNTTLTVDGQVRPNSHIDIQYLFTTSIDQRTGEVGYAGRFFAGNNSNKFYYGWVTEYTDQNYNPSMGFVRQNNTIRHNPGGYFILRPKSLDWIRRYDPGIFINFNHDAINPEKFQQASLYIFPVYLWFKDNSFVEFAFTPTWQNIDFNFAPLSIPISQDEYFYTRYTLRYNTDLSKKWSISASTNLGRFYNGTRNELAATLRIAPIPHISLSMSYEFNDIQNLGSERSDLSTHLFSLSSRLAINPRLQLYTFYQYNSFDQQGGWNIRASWEYKPLSFIYLVFNTNRLETQGLLDEEQQVISKISFVRQL